MKITKIISILLVVLMAVAMFGGCGKDATSSEETTATPISVVKNGETDFVLMKSYATTENVTAAVSDIQKAYKAEYDVSIFIRTDALEREESGAKEIIIGDTNRPETEVAKKLLIEGSDGYVGNYIICVIDGNIVIWCMHDDYYDEAAKYFVDTYVKGEIAGDLVYIYNEETEYETLSINGNTKLAEYSIVRSHYETSYLTQVELEKLHSVLRSKNGYYVPIVDDADLEAGNKEIIIGGSNRDGQYSGGDRDYYEIRIDGSKVYLDGGSDYAVSVAVREFTNAIKAGTDTFEDGVYKSGSYAETIANYDSSEYYRLVWKDEFDGSIVDENIWHACRGNEMTSKGHAGLTSFRSNDINLYVDDGKMYQVGMRDEKGYYGGMLWTYEKMHFKYGYIESKMIIPDGDGFWIALWLNGWNWVAKETTSHTNMYAEFDIIECFGNAAGFSPSLHRWPTEMGENSGIPEFMEHTQTKYQGVYKENRSIQCPDDGLFSDAFHTIGCLWTPTTIKVTCDGVVQFEHDTTIDPVDKEAFNHELFIVLSFANHFANCPLTPGATDWEWENTNKLIVDYVRLFQTDECSITLY